MGRIDEKDLFKYHKIDKRFNDHYLISAYNKVLELIEGEHDHKDTTLHTLMSCVEEAVNQLREKEKEIEKKDKYIKFLQNQLMESINK